MTDSTLEAGQSDRPIAVIGGGLAGLSAALDLADSGASVVLFEQRPFAGGKAYSFQDPLHHVTLDNGQHITMRCCTSFQAFLERLGCADMVEYQPHLEVAVIDPSSEGRHVSVIASRRLGIVERFGRRLGQTPAPLQMLSSLVTFEHLSVADKSRLALAFEPIRRMTLSQRRVIDRISFGQWLRDHHQSEAVIERFWDLIVLPTCNDRSDDVSAAQAVQVFQDGFCRDPQGADIGLFRRGLGEVAETAVLALQARGVRCEFGSAVRQMLISDRRIEAVRWGRTGRMDVSGVILALPPHRALSVLPVAWRGREPFWRLGQHDVSPIINLHMQWDRAVMRRDFVASLDLDAQFIFNRSQLHGWDTPPHWITVSLSGAHDLVDRPQREIVARVEAAVRRSLRRTEGAALLATRVVKESEATFRSRPGMGAHRVGPRTPIENLYLAGAWTGTDWPATMESAVRSGQAAARSLLESVVSA